MSDINISVTGTKRLKTAGKYCADDIVVTALGGETDIKIQSSKTVTPEKDKDLTVKADSGYDYLDTVIVKKIPEEYIEPAGTENIYKNGTYDISAFKTVNVQVPTGVDVVCSVGDSFFSDSFLEGYDVDWSRMDCSVTPSGILSATLESDYYSFEALAEGQATIHFAFLEYSGDETIYVDVSVVVTAKGSGSEDLNAVLAEQESLIAELKAELENKASGGGSSSGSNKLAEILNYEVTELTAEDLKGVRMIPYEFFLDQTNLQKVTFPDTLEEIYEDAFNYCINLENVIFGKSQNLSIDDNAFQLCENLQYIDFTACIDIPDISEYAFYAIPTTCELRVPASRVEDYKAATNWSNYESQIVGV